MNLQDKVTEETKRIENQLNAADDKVKEEVKRVDDQLHAAGDKVNEEADRIEKQTGIKKEIIIGAAIVVVLIILGKLGVI